MAQLEHYRGDLKRLNITVATPFDPDAKILFALKPLDLLIEDDSSDENAVLKKDLTSVDVTDNGNNTVTYAIDLLPSDTESLTPATYRAEFSYIDGDGNPVTFEQFDYVITADINQRS